GADQAPTAPEIAVDVAAHAVGRAGSGIDQHALVGKLGAVGRNVIGQDLAVRYAARFHNVEDFFVGRKAQPIRSQHAFGDDGGFSGCAIDAIDVGVDLGFGLVAFVVAKQPQHGIREPDRAVGFHHHVVGRVEPLGVERSHQHADGTVIFGSHHAPAAMLAGDEPALTVAGVAVGEIGGLPEDADRA